MTGQANRGKTKPKHIISFGLAAAMFAMVLAYVLGAQAILESPYAEPGHRLFMSVYGPLVQGITGGHSSMAQMHGILPGQKHTSASQMQKMMGPIGNNILGSPATLPAGGLATVVVAGALVLSVAAFVASWKQRSFAVAGLLAAGGTALVILPLANMNSVIPGPIICAATGLAILGLGVTKGIQTARAPTAM